MAANKNDETLFQKLGGHLIPNCYRALDLAEKGIEQSLGPLERLSLRYHSRLCMHCSCAQLKFGKTLNKMREAEAARKQSSN